MNQTKQVIMPRTQGKSRVNKLLQLANSVTAQAKYQPANKVICVREAVATINKRTLDVGMHRVTEAELQFLQFLYNWEGEELVVLNLTPKAPNHLLACIRATHRGFRQ